MNFFLQYSLPISFLRALRTQQPPPCQVLLLLLLVLVGLILDLSVILNRFFRLVQLWTLGMWWLKSKYSKCCLVFACTAIEDTNLPCLHLKISRFVYLLICYISYILPWITILKRDLFFCRFQCYFFSLFFVPRRTVKVFKKCQYFGTRNVHIVTLYTHVVINLKFFYFLLCNENIHTSSFRLFETFAYRLHSLWYVRKCSQIFSLFNYV